MKKPPLKAVSNVLPLPKTGRVPPELIESLEIALNAAKEGRLEDCVASFSYREGEPAAADTSTLLPMRRVCWRCDGRLDTIYAELSSMSLDVLLELTGR
jgi:hypothetical protein